MGYHLLSARKRYHGVIPRVVHFSVTSLVHYCTDIDTNLGGFKLVEFLNTKNIFIPIIFITIREDVEDEIRGLALGARD